MYQPTPAPPHSHAPGHTHAHEHRQPAPKRISAAPTRSVLAWPAWRRVLAVLPVVVALWLAVVWANEGAALW